MANIEQSICDAIEVITNNAISKAGFDRTIQATIVACMNEATGKYKIKYQDSLLYAYSADVEKRYSKGNRVYVLVPGNDDTKDKTIIGIVGQSSEYIASDYGTKYQKFGNDFIYRQPDDWYGIYSGTEYNYDSEDKKNDDPQLCERYGKIIYQSDKLSTDFELLREDLITEYLNKADYIYLGARFKTTFAEPIYNGEYGLKVLLECRDPQDPTETIFQSITLDFAHGIDGEFYSFNLENGIFKDYYFQKPNNFIRVYRIEFFAKKFDEQITDPKPEGSEDPNLFVKDLRMYAANEVIETSGLTLEYPDGNTLLSGDIKSAIRVQAIVSEDGKQMDASANNFYWFKQDLSVTSVQNDKYHTFGGLGWACLNDKNASNGDWISHGDMFEFKDNVHLLSFRTNFKVVAYRQVGDRIIKYETEFELLNDKRKDIISQITVTPNDFPLPRTAIAQLECTIDRRSDLGVHTYEYYWSAKIGDSIYTHDNLNTAPFYRTKVDDDSQKTKVENNKIENVYLNTIFSYYNEIDFSCTVKEEINGEFVTLCTANKKVLLADMYSSDSYELTLVGRTQVFMYDEYGDSPSKNGTFLPRPLTLELRDSAGNEINIRDEIVAKNLTVEWIIPEHPTLLQDIRTDEDVFLGNPLKVSFNLKGPYNPYDLDTNIIKVVVTYNGIKFKSNTNFAFLTQGANGTNGTSYSAIIVPNSDTSVVMPRWVTFFTTWHKENDKYVHDPQGYFNFGPTSDTYFIVDNYYSYSSASYDPKFPFKVKIFGGGDEFFDGHIDSYENGVCKSKDIFDNPIEIEWYMDTLQYGDSTRDFICDRSNFSAEAYSDGQHELVLKYNEKLYNYNDDDPGNRDQYLKDRKEYEFTPANILKCKIKCVNKLKTEDNSEDVNDSKEFYLYASIPIVKVVNENNFELELDQESGYSEIIYNHDACIPQYNSNSDYFAFTVKGRNENYENTLNDNQNNCNWDIRGYSGYKEEAHNVYRYKISKQLKFSGENVNKQTKSIQIYPIYEFNGFCVTNGILFTYNSDNLNTYIHIPVDAHLNRYGLAMLNEWDGSSITINNDGGYILAPQMGAGYKEDDNSFTGIVMGQAKEEKQDFFHTGLYGFKKGQKSFGLMADTGAAVFGFKGGSQIVIDPRSANPSAIEEKGIGTGLIYSGNLFKSDALQPEDGLPKTTTLENLHAAMYDGTGDIFQGDGGLLIDFTNGNIYYGNDKFHLKENGDIRSQEGHFSNNRYSIFSDKPNNQKETCFVDLKQYDENNYNIGDEYFLYCFNKNKDYHNPRADFSVTKDGYLVANAGQIGGFYISDSYISSYNDIHVPIHGGESVITLSTEQFDRQMKVVGAGYYDTDDVSLIPDDILIVDSDPVLTPYNDISKLLEEQDFNTIRYKKYNLGTLLFAIGDDFAVTENGSIYVRNVYGKGGLFLDLVCQNLYVKKEAEIQKLTVKKDLNVKGDLDVKGKARIHHDLTVDYKTTTYEFATNTGSANIFNVDNELHTGYIRASGDLIIPNDVYNDFNLGLTMAEQLPWMTYSSIDQAPLTLAPGHIYLIYENE